MYNKPITQRVAFARGKKASALKQTEDTTVLKTEKIPVIKDEVTVNLPDTTETITTPGELTGTIAEPGGEQMSDDKWLDFCDKNPCNAACHKQFGKCPDKEETITKNGGTAKEERSQYMYDYGDSMPSYMQRKVYRGLEVGSRRTGKFAKKAYKGMSDAERAKELGIDTEKAGWEKEYSDLGIKNKRQFGKAVKAKADKNALKAAKAFAETQAESARQGQSFGKKGTTKIGTFNPNETVFGGEGAVGRERTLADTSTSSQAIENQKQLQKETEKKAAVDAANNQDRVNKINDQEDAAKKDVKSPAGMKVGPLKMKSSFKMGGFGSKTYKK